MKAKFMKITNTCSLRMGLVVAVAAMILQPDAKAIPATVNLGTAGSFAVLAGSGITFTGPTTITGDIGTHPTTSITGIENVTFGGGVNHAADAVTVQAKIDLVAAYVNAFNRLATTSFGPIYDLGGDFLTSGVYNGASSFGLTGTLTLDAEGNPDAVWIFQVGSTLITASDSTVVFKDGIGSACNVFWQVGSSATLGTRTDFAGTIMALDSITLNTGATLDGRALARNGAVTLDNNNIIINENCAAGGGGGSGVPDSGSTLLLLGFGLATLSAFRRRFFSPA